MPTIRKVRTTIAVLAIAAVLLTTATPAQAFWPIGARIAAALVVPHLIASIVTAARAPYCPPYGGGYQPGAYGAPPYAPGYGQMYAPGYAPAYAPAYGAGYPQSVGPAYPPSYGGGYPSAYGSGYGRAYGSAYAPPAWSGHAPSSKQGYAPTYRPNHAPRVVAAPRAPFVRTWVAYPRPHWEFRRGPSDHRPR